MSEPKRYMSDVYELGAKGYSCILKQHAEGEFVRYQDYARLKEEVERLTKAGDMMNVTLNAYYNGWPYDLLIVRDVMLRWNAAKEGKPQP